MAVNREHHTKLQRRDLLGFFTHPGTTKDYLSRVSTDIEAGNISTIFYHNLHTVYVYLSSDEFRQSYNEKTVLVDGMVLLFVYKLAGYRLPRNYRVTYVEFIFPLMEMARDNGWRVFHVGQQAEAQDKALSVIRERVPGIEISGHHGYFDFTKNCEETQRVIKTINDYSTDLLLVGLGSPSQEFWVNENRNQLNAAVVLTCGSCMDYLAGKVKAAPRWMSRIGLEAVYRVYADPKRLAYRYLVEPLLLIKIILLNRLRRK